MKYPFIILLLGLSLALNAPAQSKNGQPTAETSRALSLMGAASDVGTSEMFGGGDPRTDRVNRARNELNHAYQLVQRGVDTDSLCSARICQKGDSKALCSLLRGLSRVQREECRSFIIRNAEAGMRLNTDASTPLVFSNVPLVVADGRGGTRTVSAMTRRTGSGSIILHYGSIQDLDFPDILALLAHELGHKIALPGTPAKFIDDGEAVGTFPSGRKFLDTVGAALAFFMLEHRLPQQELPPLPDGISEKNICPLLAGQYAPYLVGLAVDAERAVPTSARLEAWAKSLSNQVKGAQEGRALESMRLRVVEQILGSDQTRRELVRAYIKRFLLREADPEDLEVLVNKFATEGEAAVVASIVGDDQYLTAHGIKDQSQFVDFLFRDLVGRSPSPVEMTTQLTRLRQITRPSLAFVLLTQDKEARTHLVQNWYQHFLNRPATEREYEMLADRIKGGLSWETARASMLAGSEYWALQTRRWEACKTKTAQAY